MPDLWTHIIGGDMVLNELDDRGLSSVILEYRNHYNLGTQGPDFFFYNNFWPWTKEKRGPSIGALIHTKRQTEFVLEVFEILREKEGSVQYPKALSYFIGFITHLILDKKIHEIIDEKTNNNKEHKRFEIELDCILVDNYYNEKCYKLKPDSYLKIGNELDELIKDIYYLNITKLYEEKINFEVINNSYQDMLRAQNILYSPFKIKAYILSFLNNFLSIDLNQYLYAKVNSYYLITQKDLDRIEKLLPEFVSISKDLIGVLSLYLKGKNERKDVKKRLEDHFGEGFFEGG
ncbi:MAG: zinc dependent phospholipase C family protein [Halanaerobiales bacterium]